MKRHTKILAAAGALGCAALTLGQLLEDGQARQGGGNPPAGQARVAKDEVGNLKAAPLNAMQQALAIYMSDVQLYLIEKVNHEPDATKKIILAHGEGSLTIRTREQQLKEIYDVWDIDRWKPGPEWEAMTKVPTLINTLLKLDPKVEAEINAFVDKQSEEFMRPYREFIDKEGLASLPPDERNRRIYEWNQKELSKSTPLQRTQAAIDRAQKVLDFARPKLTKDQVIEMDHILGLFKQKMAAVEAAATER